MTRAVNPTPRPLALHRNDRGAQDAPMEGVLAGLALLILAGALVGNLYAQRRRTRVPMSVYEVIRKRLETERAERPPSD